MSMLRRSDAAGVALLTLDRPKVRNALSTELLRALVTELDAIQDTPPVRAVVLTGAGGTFCAGADLKEFAGDPSREGKQRRIRLVTQVIARLRNLEQPTVAAVSGAVSGAGWGLSLACDLTFASSDAGFCLPEVSKGLRLPAAITSRLVEVVGPVRAAQIAFGGAVHTAAEGLAAGWVAAERPDPEAVLEHAMTFAGDIASRSSRSVGQVKQVLRRATQPGLTPPPEYAWDEEKS